MADFETLSRCYYPSMLPHQFICVGNDHVCSGYHNRDASDALPLQGHSASAVVICTILRLRNDRPSKRVSILSCAHLVKDFSESCLAPTIPHRILQFYHRTFPDYLGNKAGGRSYRGVGQWFTGHRRRRRVRFARACAHFVTL